jgi:hypothetical protein
MRIVCAVDGSEYSHWGVQTLEALAGREPEHVALVHVIDKASLQTAAHAESMLLTKELAFEQMYGAIQPSGPLEKVPVGDTRYKYLVYRGLNSFNPLSAPLPLNQVNPALSPSHRKIVLVGWPRENETIDRRSLWGQTYRQSRNTCGHFLQYLRDNCPS